MPWLKLKKSRRYNIASKNQFVAVVQLLDNTNLECTLSSDSTAQECLESVAQRIELNNLEYFGLRYQNKKLQFRWIELDKPLKKQLDKYAHAPKLYFGVMYYVDHVQAIPDEMIRYQFFLQLKNDVIDGKLPCTTEQAIMLASYCLQAEFGDHDYERHTQDYLRDFLLLPRNMTSDERVLNELTEQVAISHRSLQGMFPAEAEVKYLNEIQQLQGFGEEYYQAKDDADTNLLLGASHKGFCVKQLNGQTVVQFKWGEVANVIHNKRVFGIQAINSAKIITFQMDEPESAKYVWRMCILQMHFSKTHKDAFRSVPVMDAHLDGSVLPDIQQSVQIVVQDVGEEDDLSQSNSETPTEGIPAYNQVYQGQDSYFAQSQGSLNNQFQSDVNYSNGYLPSNGYIGSVESHLSQVSSQDLAAQEYEQQQFLQQQQQQEDIRKAELAYRAAILPAYRPSPNYEDVMRQRMVQQHNANIANSQVYNQADHNLAYSQPEIRQSEPIYANQEEFLNHINRQMYQDRIINTEPPQPDMRNRAQSLNIPTTYSTPDLTTPQYSNTNYNNEQFINNPEYHFKPPPPYPKSPTSTSTPDLACQTVPHGNLSSSPDLISRRNIPMPAVPQTQYKSVDNLTAFHFDSSIKEVEVSFETEGVADYGMKGPPPQYRPPPELLYNSLYQGTDVHVSVNAVPPNYQNYQNIEDFQTVETLPGAQTIPHGQIVSHDNHVTLSLDHDNQQMELLEQQAASMHISAMPQEPYQYSDSNNVLLHHNNQQTVNVGQMEDGSQSMLMQLTQQQQQPCDMQIQIPHERESGCDQLTHNVDASSEANDSGLGNPSIATIVMDNASDTESIKCLDTSEMSPTSQVASHSVQSSITSSVCDQKPEVLEDKVKRSSQESQQKDSDSEDTKSLRRHSASQLKQAKLNGLTLSRPHLQPNENNEVRAPKDERRKILEDQLAQGHIFLEFEEVPKKCQTMQVCAVATQKECEDKNRFKGVIPYEGNRVLLKPTKKNKAGYINASHIKMKIGKGSIHYIATQGPLDNTVQDFWAMVWENNVQVISMLTEAEDRGKQKATIYWPQERGPRNKVKFGDYEVTLKFATDSLCYITSAFTVKHIPSKQSRMVWHLQYTDWPESGYPDDIYGFLSYLDEIETVYRHARGEGEIDERPPTPIVVHCDSGVGRSGVVILTELVKMGLEHNEKLDMKSLLQSLREQRMHMIQSVGQYSFVHKTLIQYLKNTRLI